MRYNLLMTTAIGLMLASGVACVGTTEFTASPETRMERLARVRAREAEHDDAKKQGPSVAIVKDGKPNAVIVCIAGPPSRPSGDMPAAQELQTWIELMSGVELPITENPALSGVNIYVGQAARDHGLDLADIECPSDEGFRVRSDGNKILIAGQSSTATFRAVARFLEEEFGCRWLAAPDWGMVYPRKRTLTVLQREISEAPALLLRNIHGPEGGIENRRWKMWNGDGGLRRLRDVDTVRTLLYSRYHPMGHPHSPSSQQLQQKVDEWAERDTVRDWYTYNYNLGEFMTPYSRISTYTHDLPYVYSRGFSVVTLDTLDAWELSAPHLYLSIRLSYDPRQDPWEIMADYWHHLYGPAAEAMEKYWMEIDAAFVNLHTEAGGVHSLHHVYTLERLERLDTFLIAAREVAAERPEVLDRIAVARRGFQRASFWRTYFDAMNRGDFAAMRAIYDEWHAFMEESVALGNAHGFSLSSSMGLGATGFPQLADVVAPENAPPNRIVAVLPDEWKTATRTEIDAAGLAGNPWDVDFDDTNWLTIKTFSDTRNAQGLPQYFGDIWYRTTWQTPPAEGDLLLYFVKADRRVTLYVDGQQINAEAVDAFRGAALDVTGHIQPGRQHQITVNVEHPAIAELFLGGLVHPVYLIEEND